MTNKAISDRSRFAALLLLSIFQIALFLFLYDTINWMFNHYRWRHSRGVAWGITIQYYFPWYVLIVLLSNVLIYLMNERKVIIMVMGFIVAASLIIGCIDEYPYKTIFVLVLLVITFSARFWLPGRWSKYL